MTYKNSLDNERKEYQMNKATLAICESDSTSIDDDYVDQNTKCSIFGHSFGFLQGLASKKCFMVVYILILILLDGLEAYGQGTVTTIQSDLLMSDKLIGLINGLSHFGGLFFYLILPYFIGKGNKVYWLIVAVIITSCSCFIKSIPHFMSLQDRFGGTQYIHYESVDKERKDCKGIDSHFSTYIGFFILLIAQVIYGIGICCVRIAGVIYIDDNTRKTVFPLLYCVIEAARLIGVFVGYAMASFLLELYVDVTENGQVKPSEAKFVGAWWLGYTLYGFGFIIMAVFISMFPPILPKSITRGKNASQLADKEPHSVRDFMQTLLRVAKNKKAVFDALGLSFWTLGITSFELFLPKYIQEQFSKNAPFSNYNVGVFKVSGRLTGVIISGFVLIKLKPKPRSLAALGVVFGIITLAIFYSYTFIKCEDAKIAANAEDQGMWNLTLECNKHLKCDNRYLPICDVSANLLYLSPCQAGCENSDYSNTSHNDIAGYCSCIPKSHIAVEGECPETCESQIHTFFFALIIFETLITTMKYVSFVLRIRYVARVDRSFLLGVERAVATLFGRIPSPIIGGIIIDWACTLYQETCDKTGYCLKYDSTKLRLWINGTCGSVILLGILMDAFLWYYVKDVKLYDDDDDDDSISQTSDKKAICQEKGNAH